MGKTQLVLNYLQHHQTDYEATFWIEGRMKSTIERDFVNIYRLLYGDVWLATKDGQELVSDAVLRVKSWFSNKRHRWLLVFDGVDSLDDPQDQDYVNLLEFIPMSSKVDVIITSRSKTADDLSTLRGVHVEEMEPGQALELFYKSSGLNVRSAKMTEDVESIVNELGRLALAVNLAGTYVRETPELQSDLSKYLKEYRLHQRRCDILGLKPNQQTHRYNESVLTTWETSFHAVNKQYPLAGRLLTLLAFISHDDIFMALFGLDDRDTQEHSENVTHEQSSITWRGTVSPERQLDLYMLEEGFRVLARYSLVQWQEDQGCYQMHRLVHAWGYDRLDLFEQEEFSLASTNLMDDAMSRCSVTPQARLRLRPHLMTCFGAVNSAILDTTQSKATGIVVARMGSFMEKLGMWSDVWRIKLFVGEVHMRLYGEDHPSTISAMNSLAITLRDQGRLAESAKLLGNVLEKQRKISGEENFLSISVMRNLAVVLGDQGKLDEAAKMEEEALKKIRRILGEDHLSTITSMHNLAGTLGNKGQLDEAVKMNKEVLEKRRRILGEEHSDTISSMHNLAATLGQQGHLDEAAKMNKEVLEKRQRILGEEHPGTISAMSNLATTLSSQGQIDEAAKMKKEVLEKRRRILGEGHPDTIVAMYNLSITLEDQGQLEEAVALLETAIRKMKQIYADDHPHLRMALDNLALLKAPPASTLHVPPASTLDVPPASTLEPTVQKKGIKRRSLVTRLAMKIRKVIWRTK